MKNLTHRSTVEQTPLPSLENEVQHVLTPEEEKLVNLLSEIIVNATLKDLQELKEKRRNLNNPAGE